MRRRLLLAMLLCAAVCCLAAPVAARQSSRPGRWKRLSSQPYQAAWSNVKSTAAARPLPSRRSDVKANRQRLEIKVRWTQTDLKGEPDWALPSRTLVVARPGRVLLAPRVYLDVFSLSPRQQRGAKEIVEQAFRRLDRDLRDRTLVAEAGAAGRPAQVRVRPIFVKTRRAADWELRFDPGKGSSYASVIFLRDAGGGRDRLTDITAHEAAHAVFAARDEYKPYLAKPIIEHGFAGRMALYGQPLLPHSVKPFLGVLAEATGGRFGPAPETRYGRPLRPRGARHRSARR